MFILLYHQIAKIALEQDPLRLSVSPEDFEHQMNYLHRSGYVCMPLSEAVKAQLQGKQLPSHAFSITFDDGYQDNFDQALPTLKKYGFTATIFIVPDRVGDVTHWWGVNENQRFPLMSWETIREMSLQGIEFGSHTRSHALLEELDDTQLAKELRSSKEIIERETGKPVNVFAFPYERSSVRLQAEVKKHGYLAACGSLLFPNDRFNLWRTQCYGSTTMLSFRFMTSNFWQQSVKLKYHSQFGNKLRQIKRRLVSVVQ